MQGFRLEGVSVSCIFVNLLKGGNFPKMILQVSKANFKLLLLYLDGLRGNQRGLVRERAEKVAAQTKSEKDTSKREWYRSDRYSVQEYGAYTY